MILRRPRNAEAGFSPPFARLKPGATLMVSLLLLVTCAAVAPPRPWKIEIESSGGIIGRGAGGYVLDSSGALTIRDPASSTCTYTLTDDELARIETLLTKARPKTWRASYMPENRCCDRFEWTLALTLKDATYTTEWIDHQPPAPPDLVALVRSIIAWDDPSSIRKRYSDRCRTGNE